MRHLAHLIPALALTLAFSTPARAGVSFGAEWEIEGQSIDLTAAVKSTSQEVPRYKSDQVEIQRRVMCTSARSKVDDRYPIVSITFDRKILHLGRHRRLLEVVSGPIMENAPEWSEVTAYLEKFYAVVIDECAKSVTDIESSGRSCHIPIKTLVERVPGSTTNCFAEPTNNLRDDVAKEVYLRIDLPKVGSLAETLADHLRAAHTQVSLGIELGLFGNPKNKLEALYDKEPRSYGEDDEDQAPHTLARQAYAYFLKNKLSKLGELSDDQKGFVAHYFVGLHAFNAYFASKYVASGATQPYAEWLKTYKVIEDDWRLKNQFALLPKESLTGIFGKLRDKYGLTAAKLVAGTRADFFCDESFIAGLQLDKEAPGASEKANLATYCKQIYDTYWEPSITGSQPSDPFHLDELGFPTESKWIDGALRVVFEMRLANDITRHLRLVANPTESGGLKFVEASKKVPLPYPLAAFDEDDD